LLVPSFAFDGPFISILNWKNVGSQIKVYLDNFKHVTFGGNSTHNAKFASRKFYTQGILDLEVKKSEEHTSPQTVSRTLSREEHHNDANCMFTCRHFRRNEIGKLLYPC
jgi:hypothetical protein